MTNYDEELWRLMKLITQLEKRIIQLEVELVKEGWLMDDDDAWYWDH